MSFESLFVRSATAQTQTIAAMKTLLAVCKNLQTSKDARYRSLKLSHAGDHFLRIHDGILLFSLPPPPPPPLPLLLLVSLRSCPPPVN
jgi:hypothetical protein